MSLTVSEKGGSSRPLTPAGTHIARCIQLIDLGTQTDSGQYGTKIQPKVRITWELPTERAVFTEEKGEQPFLVSKEYTASLSEKANLRHDLEGWRSVPFTEDELKGFDLHSILGKACMVTVVHKKSADGSKTYDKVASVSSLPKDPATNKRIECPAQENPTLVYDIEDGENEVFESLPEWIQKKIRESAEFTDQSTEAAAMSNSYHDDGSIPF